MNKITSHESKPVSVESLLELYNSGGISREDFIPRVIPLLPAFRQEGILSFVMKLITDNPGRYHVSSPHHAKLWREAEAAYDADIHAKLAAQPGVLEKLEETCRRVEAKLRESKK